MHESLEAMAWCPLLLGGELLTERCRTDDLMPDLSVSSLPPCRVDPKVLGLDVLIDRSESGGSWASNGAPSGPQFALFLFFKQLRGPCQP